MVVRLSLGLLFQAWNFTVPVGLDRSGAQGGLGAGFPQRPILRPHTCPLREPRLLSRERPRCLEAADHGSHCRIPADNQKREHLFPGS